MKRLELPFVFIILCSLCCKKGGGAASELSELSVTSFYNYSDARNTRCGTTLRHEGELVVVIGYVQALNTFESEGRFQLFDSASISSTRVDVVVAGNKDLVFEKLNKSLDRSNVDNFTRIRVTGKIVGTDLPMNGVCFRGASLVVADPGNVNVPSK